MEKLFRAGSDFTISSIEPTPIKSLNLLLAADCPINNYITFNTDVEIVVINFRGFQQFECVATHDSD